MKRQEEKQHHKDKYRKEEEQCNQLEDAKKEKRPAEAPVAKENAAQVVSPSKPASTDTEMEMPALKSIFFLLCMVRRMVPKIAKIAPHQKINPRKPPQCHRPPPARKHVVKSTLKTGFDDSHVQNFPRVLVEASIALKGDNPELDFMTSLQELLKNGQIVDKNFAFCPVKPDGGTKKIHDPSKVPTNMTLLSAHFKISSTKNKNPFEKQKVWKNGKEVKGKLHNPVIYFSMAIATDDEPKDLLARVCHEWRHRGGNMLKVKEL